MGYFGFEIPLASYAKYIQASHQMILFEPNLPHWKSIQNPDEKHVICDAICHLVISVCVCVFHSLVNHQTSSFINHHQPPSPRRPPISEWARGFLKRLGRNDQLSFSACQGKDWGTHFLMNRLVVGILNQSVMICSDYLQMWHFWRQRFGCTFSNK